MKIAFAFEYTLGHKTHAQNLKQALGAHPEIDPFFIEIPFETPGLWAKLPGIRSNWTVRSSLGALRGLRPLRHDLDAMLFHTQTASLFSTSLMRSIPAVLSIDATPIQYDSLGEAYGHRPSESARIEDFKKRMNLRAFEAASHLVTWSAWAKQSLMSDYGISADKITVIPPGVDIDQWSFPDRAPRPEEVNLLFVGGDFLRKGGRNLLDAFARLTTSLGGESPKRVAARLNIVSSSPDVPERHPNVVVHRGITANSEVLRALFAKADIFVFPSLGDCLPVAVMEAMAAGLPVIATDVGAITEEVIDGESGIVVPMRDPDTLATAIQRLIDDPDRRLRMGRRGREIAVERFNAAVNYGRLISLLKDQVKAGA